jgi:hypothetical protein
VILALPEIHDLRARPASPSTFAPVDVEDAKPRVLLQRGWNLLLVAMLPTDTEAKLIGPLGFGKTILNRGDEFRISVSRYGDEDGHLSDAPSKSAKNSTVFC